MIKINDIQPFDSNSKYRTLKDLEDDYLEKFRVYTQPEILLESFLNTGIHNDYRLTTITEIEILEYLLENFPSIITGTPQKLNSIINLFYYKGWNLLINTNNKGTKFCDALLNIFGYKERFRNNVGRGKWLSKQLNIKSCPYCNAQYTIIATNESNDEISKYQFDHFFPKSIYPYLSISLYNLIPSCANCNITKSAKPLNLKDHYHPYFLNLSIYAKFKLKYEPDPSKLTIKNVSKQNLTIEFVPKYSDNNELVKNHDKLYHITGIYNRHQDIAEELLIIAIIHTKGLVKGHMSIEGLFPDINYYNRYLLRNYYLQKDTLKRPLAKFTQDIAKQLGLI